MPRGPNGEKRPRDTIGCAVHVMKIATGEIDEELPAKTRESGIKGGEARARALCPERRGEIPLPVTSVLLPPDSRPHTRGDTRITCYQAS